MCKYDAISTPCASESHKRELLICGNLRNLRIVIQLSLTSDKLFNSAVAAHDVLSAAESLCSSQQ